VQLVCTRETSVLVLRNMRLLRRLSAVGGLAITHNAFFRSLRGPWGRGNLKMLPWDFFKSPAVCILFAYDPYDWWKRVIVNILEFFDSGKRWR